MSKPLALVYYSNLLPGSQLANRLTDLGYRVQTVTSAAHLPPACEVDRPLVVIAEMFPPADTRAAVARLRRNPATQHIPVLGFCREHNSEAQAQARDAGISLLAANDAIVEQLPQLLDQILQVE